MRRVLPESNQKGFTLIEMLAVLVILGVLASVTINKYNAIGDTAANRGLQAGVSELNARETLVWAKHMFAGGGYQGDEIVWTEMRDKNLALGPGYSWTEAPDDQVGTLLFRGQSIDLSRSASTENTAAKWNSI